jgi:HAD superfamily hydrolase (TIGR01544 family)
MLPELSRAGVHMKDEKRVHEIIQNMVTSGSQHLQVISDFDMTLSRFVDDDGEICESCYHAIEESRLLPVTYREAARSLKEIYYAIEIDPKLTIEQKCPYMVEWWTKAHDLLLQCDFKQSYVEQIVRDSRLFFRSGCDWLFNELSGHNVPLLIFSAGIGDVIVEVFKQRAKLHDNIKVVSNFMDFDEHGVLKGFQGELLHVFNKNENAVHQSDYFDQLMHRDNIILMGDSLGDLSMATGATECANVLNIGFLNDKVPERLASYIEAYDIVLVNDQSVDIANAILRQILYPTSPTGTQNQTVSAESQGGVVDSSQQQQQTVTVRT